MGFAINVRDTSKKAPKYEFDKDLTGKETLEDFLFFVKDALISTSRQILEEEQKVGFDKKPRVRVDNNFKKSISQVKPIGKIEYFSRVDISLALLRMYDEIIKRSPVSTGQYRSGNLVFVNGIEVAQSASGLKRFVVAKASEGGFKNGDEIRFLNILPYARKLERKGIRRGTKGKFANKNHRAGGRRRNSKKTGLSINQPNGAYYLSFRLFRRQFKQIAQFMSFRFMPNGSSGIYIPIVGRFRNTFKRDNRPYLYPSIVIKLAGEGIQGRGD